MTCYITLLLLKEMSLLCHCCWHVCLFVTRLLSDAWQCTPLQSHSGWWSANVPHLRLASSVSGRLGLYMGQLNCKLDDTEEFIWLFSHLSLWSPPSLCGFKGYVIVHNNQKMPGLVLRYTISTLSTSRCIEELVYTGIIASEVLHF